MLLTGVLLLPMQGLVQHLLVLVSLASSSSSNSSRQVAVCLATPVSEQQSRCLVQQPQLRVLRLEV